MRTAPLLFALSFVLAGCAASPAVRPEEAEVITTDVHRFVQVFSQLDPADSTCRGLDTYFEKGTEGFKAYRKMVGAPEDLCRSIRRRPDAYAALAMKLEQFESLAAEIKDIYRRFGEFYPDAVFPSVYFVVGRFMSAGTVKRGRVILGAEMIRTPEGVPCMVAHELVHAQQRYPWYRLKLSGGPEFLRGTVLAHSIKEGSADFLAEAFAGCEISATRAAYVSERGREVWEEFRRDMNGKDFSGWLYNGRREDRPADLGYYMGYLITRSYYEKAQDKGRAVREILMIRDFDRFLDESGYKGEM